MKPELLRESKSRPSPNLSDIARSAGVSKSTVSRALRGNPLLPASTIRRIRKLATSLGYNRSLLVGEVMRRVRVRSHFKGIGEIAYLTFDATPTGWRQQATFVHFFEGARARAQRFGLRVEPFWMNQPGLTPRRATAILEARGIDGLLVGPTTGWARPPEIDFGRFCAVKIGVPYPELPLPCAGHHHFRGMKLALAEIERRDYQRPGLVLRNYQEAKTGGAWSAALFHRQQQRASRDRVPPLWLDDLSLAEFAKWFRRHRPDVVLALSNYVPSWLRELGCRIPRDVGYVDLDRCTADRAGIDQRSPEIGAAAVDLLVGQLLAPARNLPSSPPLLLLDGIWANGPTVRSL